MYYVSKFKGTFIKTVITCALVALVTGYFAYDSTKAWGSTIKWSILGIFTIGTIISVLLTKGSDTVKPIFDLIGATISNGLGGILAGSLSMDGAFFVIAFIIFFIKAMVYFFYAAFLFIVLVVTFWNTFFYYSIMSVLELCHVVDRNYAFDEVVQKSGKVGAVLLIILSIFIINV